jgi:hypothetical protein
MFRPYIPKNLGVGVDFRPCSEGSFPHQASVVRDLVGGYLGHSVTKRKCRPYDIYNQSKCSETFKNPLFFHKRGENVKYYKNLRQKKIIDVVNKLKQRKLTKVRSNSR